jgi:hypothetical protein
MELFAIGIFAVLVVFLVVSTFKSGSKAVKVEPTPAPAPAPKPKAPAPKVDANDNGIVSKAELNKLTKVQLFDLAEKQSLKVKKSGTKAAVVSEIWSQLRQK